MSAQDKTLKAGDVFAQSPPVFGSKGKFEDAFPEIEELRVEVDFGADYCLGRVVHSYDTKTLPGEHINCRKPDCFDGGFSIGKILREMVENRRSDYSGTVYCQGYEGSPKGRKSYGKCHESFKVKILIQFKNTAPNAPR